MSKAGRDLPLMASLRRLLRTLRTLPPPPPPRQAVWVGCQLEIDFVAHNSTCTIAYRIKWVELLRDRRCHLLVLAFQGFGLRTRLQLYLCRFEFPQLLEFALLSLVESFRHFVAKSVTLVSEREGELAKGERWCATRRNIFSMVSDIFQNASRPLDRSKTSSGVQYQRHGTVLQAFWSCSVTSW